MAGGHPCRSGAPRSLVRGREHPTDADTEREPRHLSAAHGNGHVLTVTGSAWTTFFSLLLIEAAVVAILVGVVMRHSKESRRAGWVVVSGVVVAPLAAVLHNALSVLGGGEDAVWFVAALVVAPLLVVAGTFAVAHSLRSADHQLAVGFAVAALGMALFPLYAAVVIVAGPLLDAPNTYQGALEAILLPMCLAVTAMGIAYTGLVLIRPRPSLA
jgi:hypothetical protein